MIEIILEPIVRILRNLTGLKTYSYTLLITETCIQLRLEKGDFICSFSIPWLTTIDSTLYKDLELEHKALGLTLSLECVEHLASIPLKTCPEHFGVEVRGRYVEPRANVTIPGYVEDYWVAKSLEDRDTADPEDLTDIVLDLSNYHVFSLLGRPIQLAVISSSGNSIHYWGFDSTHSLKHVYTAQEERRSVDISVAYTSMLANTFSKHKRLPYVGFTSATMYPIRLDSRRLGISADLLIKLGKENLVVKYYAEGPGWCGLDHIDSSLRSIQSEFEATYANTKGILYTSGIQAIADYLKANSDEKLVYLARESYLEVGDFTKYLLNSKHPIVKVRMLEDKFMVEYQLDQTSTYSVMLTTYQKVTSTK